MGSHLTFKPLYWTLALLTLVGLTLAAGASARARRAPQPPNIVFVLTDDLDWSLVQYMPHVQRLQAKGTTFTNYFVTDSLCCPSRATIFTGCYPHNTGIFTNGPDGGFALFHTRGEETDTFATRLQDAGYRTALMGKYLNGYAARKRVDGQGRYIPPGWSEWDVAGNGYPEFDYNLNENGRVVHYGSGPRAYLTDVLARKGSAFVHRASAAGKPFFLEVSTFAPHSPYTPAPRNAADLPGLQTPRTPAFNEANVSDKPPWLRNHPLLDPGQINYIDAVQRLRAQAVEAVDDLIARLQSQLRRDGVAGNTYFFFSSDNGYHLGDHRLMPGKLTAFETDIRVPLVVAGPHVVAGRDVARITENVDLYPTFVRLGRAGTSPLADGKSLVPLLRGDPAPDWRDAALVEHHGPDYAAAAGPDAAQAGSGNPSTYEALRVPQSIYVEYANGGREYYDLKSDPYELTNAYSALAPKEVDALHSRLAMLERCRGVASCHEAARR